MPIKENALDTLGDSKEIDFANLEEFEKLGGKDNFDYYELRVEDR
jgi:hypothetical protein